MNTEFQNLPNVVSPKEMQTYFGISRSTTYRIFHDASFPAFHIGNRLLVRRDELLDWLEQQKVNKFYPPARSCTQTNSTPSPHTAPVAARNAPVWARSRCIDVVVLAQPNTTLNSPFSGDFLLI